MKISAPNIITIFLAGVVGLISATIPSIFGEDLVLGALIGLITGSLVGYFFTKLPREFEFPLIAFDGLSPAGFVGGISGALVNDLGTLGGALSAAAGWLIGLVAPILIIKAQIENNEFKQSQPRASTTDINNILWDSGKVALKTLISLSEDGTYFVFAIKKSFSNLYILRAYDYKPVADIIFSLGISDPDAGLKNIESEITGRGFSVTQIADLLIKSKVDYIAEVKNSNFEVAERQIALKVKVLRRRMR